MGSVKYAAPLPRLDDYWDSATLDYRMTAARWGRTASSIAVADSKRTRNGIVDHTDTWPWQANTIANQTDA